MGWLFDDEREAGPEGPRALWEVKKLPERGRGDFWLPVVVRVPDGLDLLDAERILGGQDQEAVRHLPPHEGQLLRAEAAAGPRRAGVTAQVYVRLKAVQDLPRTLGRDWEVLEVGSPVQGLPGRERDAAMGADPSRAAPRRSTDQASPPPDKPILAVIDDAIGFLHQRFQLPNGGTRFRAVWLQATQWQGGALPGTVIEAERIKSLLAIGDEAEAYRILNDTAVPPGGHRATERRAGHGTHVLDLAAGAEAGQGALADCPLLAVQLPPGALALTSSRWIDPWVVAALRWIVTRALPAPGTPPAPLIVTLSLGSFGGALDGNGWLEREVGKAVETYRLLSGGGEMRVVAAFGNARRARAVARDALAPGKSLEVDWRVLPDDRTDSWLALRVPPGAGGSVAMRLLPPGGAAPLDLPTFVAPAEAWWLQTAGGTPIAAAFGHGEAGHDVVRLVVGATAREDGKPAAPSGAWRVVVTNHGEVEVTVTMQVERDDTPEGYRLRGRQSWLDHPEGWSWEAETAGWTGTGGPISRAGTATTLAGLRDGAVLLVAGGERLFGEDVVRPTRDSAEGGPGVVAFPTLLARSDDGRVRAGRRAAGLLTGSTARMGGTSVAAPLVARALAGLALEGKLGQGAGNVVELATIEALTDVLLDPPDRRAGRGVLSETLP